MAEIRFHLGEHMPGSVARGLRRVGIDVETSPEAGVIGAPDHIHLAHAQARGRVVVTDDSDFAALHYRVESHSGIAYFPRGRRPIGEYVEMLTLLHATYTAEEMVGRLEWL